MPVAYEGVGVHGEQRWHLRAPDQDRHPRWGWLTLCTKRTRGTFVPSETAPLCRLCEARADKNRVFPSWGRATAPYQRLDA